MQNVAIIGLVVVVVLGAAWFLSSSNTNSTVVDSTLDTVTDVTSDADPAESDPSSDTTTSDTDTEMSEPNIVDVAMETEDLSTLVTAVSEAQLVGTLQGEGPYTVFAPTNAAFDALPDGTFDTLLMPENQSQLQSILTYHVVPGEVTAADLTDGMTVETVNGETLTINLTGSTVTINGSATVTTADVMTSNGVVHIIDGVLLPESAQ